MKKNTPITRMAFIAIITLLLSITIANAQPYRPPTEECKPAAAITTNTIPAAPTQTVTPTPAPAVDMVPYLVSFNAAGAVVKKERLASAISSTDTFYYDQKGDQIKKKDVVRWFPKHQSDLSKEIAAAKWIGRRSLYAALCAAGYSNREADSLARAIEKVVNSNADSRPLISSIMSASPNAERLLALESKDADLEGRLQALESKDWTPEPIDMTRFVESDTFNVFKNDMGGLWDLQIELNASTTKNLDATTAKFAAIDAQLSATKGKLWEKMKARYGVIFDHNCLPVAPATTQVIHDQGFSLPQKNESQNGNMSMPANF